MSIIDNITEYKIVEDGEKIITERDVTIVANENFVDLNDAPSSYSGEAGKVVSVKSTEDGLEFSTVSGTGDMTKAVYDPNLIEADAFDQDNMIDGTTNKNYTATEKTKLSGIETGADVTDATNVGSSIDGAGASSTINDTDKFASVVSGTLKTNLFSLIKSTLKTYFDGLYQTVGNYFDKTADTLDDISDGVTYVKSHNDYTTTEKNDVALNTSHRSNTSNPHATSDANLNLTDITTNDVSITKHGFAPKLPNDATKYLDGTGAYTIPAGSGASPLTTKGDLYTYGTADDRLPVGADNYVLIADSSQSLGIKWGANSPTLTNQSNIIYVGKHGSDSDNGLTMNSAKLTFSNAITTATAGDVIVCLDSGTYTENLNITKQLEIFAPNCEITPPVTTTHSIIIGADDVILTFRKITNNTGASYYGIYKNAGTGKAIVNCQEYEAGSSNVEITVGSTNGTLIFNSNYAMAKGNTTLIGSDGTLSCGALIINIGKLYVDNSSAGGDYLLQTLGANSSIKGNIGEIEVASTSNLPLFVMANTGLVKINANFNEPDFASGLFANSSNAQVSVNGYERCNRTVNFAYTETASEIQAKINAVEKNLFGTTTITFQFGDGTYTLSDTIEFAGYKGGNVYIYGNSADNSLSTTKSVVLNGSANPVLNVSGNKVSQLWVWYLKVEQTANAQDVVRCWNNQGDILWDYDYIKNYAGSTRNDLYFWATFMARVVSTYVENGNIGIYAANSNVLSNNNASTGTNPSYGLYTSGGIIFKNGTQPTGSTANEYTKYTYIQG